MNHYINLHSFINENYCMIPFDCKYLFEMFVTDERKELVFEYKLNKIIVGGNPFDSGKLPLLTFLSNDSNEIVLLTNLIRGVCAEKIGEINDGVPNSLKSKVDSYSDKTKIKVYVWNEWVEDELNKNIDKEELAKNKEEFFKLIKEQSGEVVIDLTKENKSDLEKYWNKLFNLVGGFVGVVRGQWICKFLRNRILFNDNPLRDVNDFRWYFHLTEKSKFNEWILRSVRAIEEKYKIKINIHGHKTKK